MYKPHEKFTLTVDLENDAFHDYPDGELAAILSYVAGKIRNSADRYDYHGHGEEAEGYMLHDSNGNTVGKAIWQ